MKKIFPLILLLTSHFSLLSSLSAQTTFQKTFGGSNNDTSTFVQQTTDGGFVIAGRTLSFGTGYGDVYLIKTDFNGDTLWTKTFGGSSGDEGYSVRQTNDGGFIVVGRTLSFAPGFDNVYLIKINSSGNMMWTENIGGNISDEGYSIQQTTDGGFVIAGETQTFGAGGRDAYLIKTNSSGNILWTKTFGGSGQENSQSVQQTSDGGFVLIGTIYNSFNIWPTDIYLIKTDTTGNILWTKTFGGAGWDDGSSVQQTTDGGFVLAGSTSSFGVGSANVYLIKTNSNGNMLWSKTFGGTGGEEGRSVQQTTDGGFIISGVTGYSFGSFDSDVYLIKTDSIGNLLWSKTFGGSNNEGANSISQTSDGGFVLSGYTNSFGAGDKDVYLIKTDSNGNSGCYEANPNTITTTPSTLTGNPATQVSSGGIVGNPATQTGSGGVVTTLCTSAGISELNPETSISVFPNPTTGIFTVNQRY